MNLFLAFLFCLIDLLFYFKIPLLLSVISDMLLVEKLEEEREDKNHPKSNDLDISILNILVILFQYFLSKHF